MKAFFNFLIFQVCLLPLLCSAATTSPRAGFYLPDSVQEVSFRYKTVHNLVLLPVTINDSIHVNLILDTGCRNLVLFGKRFQKLFEVHPKKKIQFAGLGSGKPIYGSLSINNKVSIDAVLGEKIPVVIVPHQNLFSTYANVHGVIGYDVFTRFEIELNPRSRYISFRPAATATLPSDFINVPLRIEDSRPVIDCEVVYSAHNREICNLMIDTGSILGLLLKTNALHQYPGEKNPTVLGRGFNGLIEGVKTYTSVLRLGDVKITAVETGIIQSPWHNYASVGMNILKDYALILNYCKAYAGFKKL